MEQLLKESKIHNTVCKILQIRRLVYIIILNYNGTDMSNMEHLGSSIILNGKWEEQFIADISLKLK